MTFNPSSAVPRSLKSAAAVLSVLALAAVSACGKTDNDQTAGQKIDSAVASTEQAATEATAKAEAATQKAEASGVKMAQSMAGKAADAAITASISSEFAKDADLSAIKIDVDTKDGNVTLYGPAPTAAASDKATTLAKSIKGVVSVSNKLTVKGG